MAIIGFGEIAEKLRRSTVLIHAGGRGSGSGVILSSDGYIVTNGHVVQGARKVRVRLQGLERHPTATSSEVLGPIEAKLVGVDRQTDLAVLKIDMTGLPALQLADSDTLKQGQVVFAFGSPLGLENSVTMGVVSATARQIDPDNPSIFIQTDAPINPGNSGGPLVDVDGHVVGINTFILTQSGGNEGLGFAIPSNVVRNIYDQIRTEGHVHRGQIGVFLRTISPELVEGLHLPVNHGLLLEDVAPGSPADKAGLKAGDVITSIGGKPARFERTGMGTGLAILSGDFGPKGEKPSVGTLEPDLVVLSAAGERIAANSATLMGDKGHPLVVASLERSASGGPAFDRKGGLAGLVAPIGDEPKRIGDVALAAPYPLIDVAAIGGFLGGGQHLAGLQALHLRRRAGEGHGRLGTSHSPSPSS